jgi:hypothetical protein
VFPHEARHQGRSEQWRAIHRALTGADEHELHQNRIIGRKTTGCGTFYRQQKTAITIRLAKMNPAVHEL